MGKLNEALCASDYGNTGFGDCYFQPDKFIGAIQVPSDFEISEEDLDDFAAFIEQKLHAGIGARIFPYPKFIGITDNTEDITINTTEYGDKVYVKDGFYDWTFRYQVGGVQLHQELKKNEGTGKYFLFFDKANYLVGYQSEGKLKGIPVDQFRVLPWRPNTGAESALYNMRFIMDPLYMNGGNLGFVKVEGYNLVDMRGLQNIRLRLVEEDGNTFTVKPETAIGNVQLYNVYKSQLLNEEAWRAMNLETNTVLAVTAVADNAAAEAFDLTINVSGMANGDRLGIRNAAGAVMNASPINVSGYEGKDYLVVVIGPES